MKEKLTELPNIGPKIASTLNRLGVHHPNDLKKYTADQLYQKLNSMDLKTHSLCLLDVFAAAIDTVNGLPPRPWWVYSKRRNKQTKNKPERKFFLAV